VIIWITAKENKNKKSKKMYTPEGYISDPPDAICPHCGQKQKSCSYVNSLSRSWARSICAKKNSKFSWKR
jgi:uncharacterized OB-fold protein